MDQFTPSRGIRQGDPLSPYLFLLISEGLTGLLNTATSLNLLHGVQVTPNAPMVSHLLFADDSLPFLQASQAQAAALKTCLTFFEQACQKVNYDKSALSFGPNTPTHLQQELRDRLQIPLVQFHEKYLGLPTQVSRNKSQAFRQISERLDVHLQGWQGKFLSKAGKLVLVKAVAQAIPTYSMSVFQLPVGICRKFQSKVSRFWWSKEGGKHNMHWLSWEKLCKRKDDGGLGLRDLRLFNQALLARTGWRIFWGPRTLVGDVLKAKYFPNTSFLKATIGRNPSCIWRGFLWGKQILGLGVRWRIGNGLSVSITKDKWLPTPSTFKPISQLPFGDQITVSSLFGPSGHWDCNAINANFLPNDAAAILSIPLESRTQPDKLIWHFTSSGVYSARSGYWVAHAATTLAGSGGECSTQANGTVWKKIWDLNLPPKIKVFLWRAVHDILPTGHTLSKRHIASDSSYWRCYEPVESATHILWDCKFARQTWKLTPFVQLCGKVSVPNFMMLFSYICSVAVHEEVEQFALTAWWLWRNRNSHRHQETVLTAQQLHIVSAEWYSHYSQANISLNQNPSLVKQLATWTPPSAGTLKLNFDGALDSVNGTCGLGVVLRDCNSQTLATLAIPVVGYLDSLAVEATALLEGAIFTAAMGIKNVEIEGDCQNLINGLSSTSLDNSVVGHIVEDIKRTAGFFDHGHFQFIRRSGNSVAHSLAKEALNLIYPSVRIFNFT